jgi:glycosyltransferase involved in cell wall biosynthesis
MGTYKKLLFINQIQFGYHIDYLKYCKYLKSDFYITYLCWDYNWDKVSEDNIEIIYVSRSGNILSRNVRFIHEIIKLIRKELYHVIFVNYFRGCSIIPLLFNKRSIIHLDIRTGSVSRNDLSRSLYNILLSTESKFFRSVSIISSGLQKLLKITSRAYILPLGADPLIIDHKPEHKLSLLYIGTFNNRHLEETIDGVGLFLQKHQNFDLSYIIIGSGWGNESNQITNKIKMNGLADKVILKGYILQKDLVEYFEKSNLGVSYIPITPWFDFQPSTKTFEYLMAGIPVIATGTFENKKVVNETNGFIIDDNPVSFSECLEIFANKIDSFDEQLIRNSVEDYKWETIVLNLKDFINKL